MTIVRRLDDNHDMTFGYGRSSMAERSEACAQCVKTRLLLLQEEWFLDTSAGLPWLQKIMVKPARLMLANKLIKRSILGTVDVQGIRTYNSIFDHETRRMSISVSVITVYGDVLDIKVER